MALPKSWTTVTPFSKYLALALFVAMPFFGFYLGLHYQTKNSSSQTTSGIFGKATFEPTCPVQKDGQNCTKPFQGDFEVMNATPNSDEIVKTFSTDSAGNFRVSLPAGHYSIFHKSNIPPTLRTTSINVSAGDYSQVDLILDSGIR